MGLTVLADRDSLLLLRPAHQMNATALLKQMTPMPPAIWRVRSRMGDEGTVIDVGVDGWVYWVGDDHACHVSRPDYLETLR